MNLAAARRTALLWAPVFLVVSAVAGAAAAAPEEFTNEPASLRTAQRYPGEDDDEYDDDDPSDPAKGFAMDRAPRWSVGGDGYAGIAGQVAGGVGRSHALAGGLLRLRWSYIQVGGTYEQTDYVEDEWRAIGVHAGAFIPYSRWVDFEFVAGGASRRYSSTDKRFGPSGYTYSVPAITLRAGVSDRSTERLVGARLGFHLVASMDLKSHEAAFRYQISDNQFVSGARDIGGFSLALVMSLGLDVGARLTKQ